MVSSCVPDWDRVQLRHEDFSVQLLFRTLNTIHILKILIEIINFYTQIWRLTWRSYQLTKEIWQSSSLNELQRHRRKRKETVFQNWCKSVYFFRKILISGALCFWITCKEFYYNNIHSNGSKKIVIMEKKDVFFLCFFFGSYNLINSAKYAVK